MNKELSYFDAIVEKREINPSDNPRAPYGFVYFEGNKTKYTVWKKEEFEKLLIGSNFEIGYELIENDWNGKIFSNFNVHSIREKDIGINEDKISFNQEEIDILNQIDAPTAHLKKGESNSGLTLLGYDVKISEVSEILLPKEVFDYILLKNLEDGQNN